MEAPRPKQEIIITKSPTSDISHHLRILTFSDDAKLFIEREGPKFGNFYPIEAPTVINSYDLYVFTEAYDMNKVKEYLEQGE